MPKPSTPTLLLMVCEILGAFADQGADQIFGHAAESEAADHDGGAVEDVADGFVGVGDDFVH